MEIALETFRKPAMDMPSETIGRSTITIGETGYLELEKLEKQLLDSGQTELMVDTDGRAMQLDTPIKQDDLRETRIRVFLDEDAQAGFHIVAKHAQDDSLIYTEPAMVRLVVV